MLCLLSIFSQAFADIVVLGGFGRCPYICEESNKKPGFLIDIATHAFERNGHKVEFRVLPWKRAIQFARDHKIDGIVGVLRKNVPDFIFPEEEQAFQQQRFYVRANHPWHYTGLMSLKKIRLGVIDGYSYGQLDSYIRKYQGTGLVEGVAGLDGLRRILLMFDHNRVTGILEDYLVMNYQVERMGRDGQFVEAGRLFGDNIYIAFSPGSPKSEGYAVILSRTMKQLRETGELDLILGKYNIIDWIGLME